MASTKKLVWRCLLPHTTGPLARSSHAISVINNTAYLFGGENVPRIPVCSGLYTFDLDKKEEGWKALEVKGTPPSARIAPAMVSIDKVLWVFGGRMGIDMSEGPLDDLWSFDTSTSTWTEVIKSTEAQGGPTKRSFHQMVAYEGKLYVFGGCGAKGRMSDLHSYDPSTGLWEALPSQETIRGRGGAAVTAVDGKVIILAGFAGEETRDMWAFDVTSKKWEDWSSYSASLIPRSVFKLLPMMIEEDKKSLVLFGGEVDPSSEGHLGSGMFAGDTLALDLSTPSSSFVSVVDNEKEAPSPRGWYAAANGSSSSSSSFILSGGLSPSNERLGDVWVLEPAQD